MSDLRDREVQEMGDALSRQDPFIKKVGDALAERETFVDKLGDSLCSRGTFMDTVAEQIVHGIIENLQGRFIQINSETVMLIEKHEEDCKQPEGLRRVEAENKEWHETHKHYHYQNEPIWGFVTLLKRNIQKVIWMSLVFICFMLVTGLSLREALIHFVGWDKVTEKQAPKNDK